jgi:hypothetical protein
MDAHRARVPDRAQIELAIDELRSAGYGRGRGEERREHGVPVSGGAPVVTVDGSTASVRWETGAVTGLRKVDGAWLPLKGLPLISPAAQRVAERGPGISSGSTFRARDLSVDHGIARLTGAVTQERLGRRLFGAPEKTAAYYRASFFSRAPFVEATYVQFVTDPAWGRVLYGSVDRWIRSLPVHGPSGVATDADGRVFIGERGASRVLVARLNGTGDDATLQVLRSFTGMAEPTDLAIDDGGTPLTTADDLLVVADAAGNSVRVYAVGGAGAQQVAAYEGFESPTAVAVGRTNGVCNGRLYVVDRAGRRLRAFRAGAEGLQVIGEVSGSAAEYFRTLKVDHFGGVYVVDNTGSRLIKYSPLLEYLDEEGGPGVYHALAAVDIPFGAVTIENEGTFWTGFDQVFALERWGSVSGAQRRVLALALRDVRFDASEEEGEVRADFRLTDAGELRYRVTDARGRVVRETGGVWMGPGTRGLFWDRRDDAGRMVPPGEYRCEIIGRSAYRDEQTSVAVRAVLPLYFYEDCGDSLENLRPHRVIGQSVGLADGPSGTADEDPVGVEYRFEGVQTGSSAEVRVEVPGDPAGRRIQRVVVNGVTLLPRLASAESPVRTEWLEVPAALLAAGSMVVRVEASGAEGVLVSQLWVRQRGTAFAAEPLDATIPTGLELMQNYPNPFNPVTVIRFAVPERGPVTLKLYTIGGAEVATLVDDQRSAGVHEALVDTRTLGGGLASGVYLYRLVQGGRSETRKMLLLK